MSARNRWRLVAFVNLVVYLFANTHIAMVADAALSTRNTSSETAITHAGTRKPTVTPDHSPKSKPSCCQKCLSKHYAEETTSHCCPHQISQEQHNDTPCPCCPEGPNQPWCPFPGGCAFCNVAKIPFTTHNLQFMGLQPQTGTVLTESISLPAYTLVGELFRPPRFS